MNALDDEIVPPDARAAGRWLRRETAVGRGAVARAGLCRIGQGAAAVGQTWAIALCLGALVAGSGAGVAPLLAFVALIPVRAAFAAAAERIGAGAAIAVKSALRHRLLCRILALGRAERDTGALAALTVDQVEALDAYVARYLPQRLAALVLPPAILAVVATIDPASALLLAAVGLAAPLAMAVVGVGTAARARSQFAALARMSAVFHDRLQGLTTLRLFGRVEREAGRIAAAADDFRARTMGVLRLAFLSSAALDLCALGAVALVAGRVALSGTFGTADGVLLILLAIEFLQPLRLLAAGYHDRMTAIGAADALRAAADAPLPAGAHEAGATLPDGAPEIVFADVHLAFDAGDRPALQGADFVARAGETIALVGESGAGKTTVLQILLGFLEPDAGRVTIAGRAIGRLPREALLSRIAWVGQAPMLFHGTLGENVALGRPEAEADAVEQACRRAGLADLLRRLPRGLDTPIGERGIGLSGGEAQRVALARAFLKDAPILLLDEPTASLDPATEAELIEALRDLSGGRTTILATHSAALAALADRRVRLDAGRTLAEAA
jgi:thiol reductant ABC exporter CydD subunit